MNTDISFCTSAFSALTLLVLAVRKSIWPVKNMLCWCGCLPGARCRLFACGPADATAIPIISCLIEIQTDFTFLVLTSGWVWVGECSFWYRPTRVVPDQRPLNGRCCTDLPRFSWKRGHLTCSGSSSCSFCTKVLCSTPPSLPVWWHFLGEPWSVVFLLLFHFVTQTTVSKHWRKGWQWCNFFCYISMPVVFHPREIFVVVVIIQTMMWHFLVPTNSILYE